MERTSDEAWVSFEAIVATTHRVDKYGGVALADSALSQMVEALNSGQLPLIGHHDWTKPLRTKELVASLVTLDDGERAVKLVGLVDQGDWDAVGEIGGMSYSACEPLGRVDGPNPQADPLQLSADAAWFDDQSIAEACSVMSRLAPVEGARLLQFSAADIARVIVEIGYAYVATLGPGLATNALWDGIKYLLLHRRARAEATSAPHTRIEMRTPLPTGGEVVGIIDTEVPSVASEALATYAHSVTSAFESGEQGKRIAVWNGPGVEGGWIPSEDA